MSSAELLSKLVAFLSAEIEKSGKITDEMTDTLRNDFLNTPRTEDTDLDKLTATIAALQSADRLTQRYESLVQICHMMIELTMEEKPTATRDQSLFLEELYEMIDKNIGLEEIHKTAAEHFGIQVEEKEPSKRQEDEVTLF